MSLAVRLSRGFSTVGQKAEPLRRPETTVIVGGGQMAIPVLLRSLSENNRVIVCTANPGRLNRTLEKAGKEGARVSVVPTSYHEGSDATYWKSVFQKIESRSNIRVVNTRGVSSLPENSSFDDVILKPTIALFQGFDQGTRDVDQRSFANCSSSAASIEKFPEQNAYAQARKKTDERLTEMASDAQINGANLRLDLVKSPREVDTLVNPNHGVSHLELTHSCFQVVVERDNLLATQPVSEDQVSKALLSPKLYANGFSTIDIVGPKAYSQRELYEFYSNLYGKPLRIIRVPANCANWAAQYINVAQVSFGVSLLKHRAECPKANQPLSSKKFEELIEESVLDLEEIHEAIGGPVVGVRSPTGLLVSKIGNQLIFNRAARKDFMADVVPHLPNLVRQAAATLV